MSATLSKYTFDWYLIEPFIDLCVHSHISKSLDCSEICRRLISVKRKAWQVAAIWFPISFTSCGRSSSRVPFRCQDSKPLINVLAGTRQSPPRPLNTSTPSAQSARMFHSRTSGGALAGADRLSPSITTGFRRDVTSVNDFGQAMCEAAGPQSPSKSH